MFKRKITRDDSIRLFLRVTDQDDPYWEYLMDDIFKLEENEPFPTIYEVLAPLGISKEELDRLEKGASDDLPQGKRGDE